MNAKTKKIASDRITVGKSALDWLNQLQSDRIGIEKREPMSRQKWYELGGALAALKEQHPALRAFGDAVRANALNKGMAKNSQVRSDAIFLFEEWHLLQHYKTTLNHPTQIRQAWKKESDLAPLANQRMRGAAKDGPLPATCTPEALAQVQRYADMILTFRREMKGLDPRVFAHGLRKKQRRRMQAAVAFMETTSVDLQAEIDSVDKSSPTTRPKVNGS